MLKWAIELSEYEIKYQPRLSLKGQVIADFIAKLPKKETHPSDCPGEQWWTLLVDGTSRVFRSRVGLILQSPTGELMEQAIHLNFSTSNNKAEYEVVLDGLDLALVLIATKLEIRSNSQLIIDRFNESMKQRMNAWLATSPWWKVAWKSWMSGSLDGYRMRRMGRKMH